MLGFKSSKLFLNIYKYLIRGAEVVPSMEGFPEDTSSEYMVVIRGQIRAHFSVDAERSSQFV